MVYDQFCGMSEILEDMAQELELYEKYDFALGEQLSTMLRASGVLPIDVSCRVDRYNRLSVEIEAAKEEAAALFKRIFCGRLTGYAEEKWMHPVSAQRRTGAGFSLVKSRRSRRNWR